MDFDYHYTEEQERFRREARVTAMRVEGGECLVECEVWVENAEGETSTTGSAMVVLPSRAGS